MRLVNTEIGGIKRQMNSEQFYASERRVKRRRYSTSLKIQGK